MLPSFHLMYFSPNQGMDGMVAFCHNNLAQQDKIHDVALRNIRSIKIEAQAHADSSFSKDMWLNCS